MTDQEFCLLTQDPHVVAVIAGSYDWGDVGTWYCLWTRAGGREEGFRGQPADTIDERSCWVELSDEQTERLDAYLRKFRGGRHGRH